MAFLYLLFDSIGGAVGQVHYWNGIACYFGIRFELTRGFSWPCLSSKLYVRAEHMNCKLTTD